MGGELFYIHGVVRDLEWVGKECGVGRWGVGIVRVRNLRRDSRNLLDWTEVGDESDKDSLRGPIL